MRYSASNLKGFKYSEPAQRIQTQSFYSNQSLPSTCQVCVSQTKAMINLASVETRTQEKAAGATIDQIKNTLFQYSWWLKKEGYAETTITTRAKLLKILAKRGADLHNPESIKETIACQEK
jgi:hypothetical protein